MLHGHERAITQIKYNREGDLLFSCAKDPNPNVWYSLNGERLGSYRGHTGAVWGIDVNCILFTHPRFKGKEDQETRKLTIKNAVPFHS